ncbi:MAG: OsmC family protein [Acetobacteraceae bacterium]|nr:OsmC family protein [Acetobacteraceae bacterium]
MDAEKLRTLQTPLKQRYRETPDTAITSARAEASISNQDIACVIRTWDSETMAGLHPATGGTGDLACSADMLLEALVACAGVTLRAVAIAMAVPVRGGRIFAEGSWDARGTLGIDKTVPVGLTDIRLSFELDTDAERGVVDRLIATTERFCVILQTLRNPPRLSASCKVVQSSNSR